MIYVYAETAVRGSRWARERGLRPSEVTTFGTWSNCAGVRFTEGDRVVVLGTLQPRIEAVLELDRRKAPAEVIVERHP